MKKFERMVALLHLLKRSGEGLYAGDIARELVVRLRFRARVAPLVKEVRWHPKQKIEEQTDGSLVFSAEIPFSPELTSWILSWGADCEVLAPKEVREEVRSESENMARIYENS